MVLAYIDHYRNDGFRTIAVEKAFELPLYNWQTGEPIPGATYCGKIDCLLEKDGKFYIGDHKTASRVDEMYWLELQSNAQLTTYVMACQQMGIPIAGVIWDVVLKPGDRQNKLSGQGVPKRVMNQLEEGIYHGMLYTDRDWETNGNLETPKMHGLRTLAEMSRNAGSYFFRETYTRNALSIVNWLQDLGDIHERMTRARATGRSLRNLSNCTKYNKVCEYHTLCCGVEDAIRHFRKREGNNTDGFGSESMSVSSVNQFNSCERAWYHRKVEKIEHAKPEYDSALAVGSMFHEALEIWLSSRMSDVRIEFVGNLLENSNE